MLIRRGKKRTGVSRSEHLYNTRHFIFTLIVRLAIARKRNRLKKKELLSSITFKHRLFARSSKVIPASLSSIYPATSVYKSYRLALKFQYSDVYIQLLTFQQEKGRKDTLRFHNDRDSKDLYRGPWNEKDARYITSFVRIRTTAFMLYLCTDLHIRPHGSEEIALLDKVLVGVNVDVINVSPANNHKIELESIGVYVYYERDPTYMSRMPSSFHQCLLQEIISSNTTDNGRTVGDFHTSVSFGIIRSQRKDKGCSFGCSDDCHPLRNESVKGIFQVGLIAQEAVKVNYPSAFNDAKRKSLVSETMCRIMGVSCQEWNWEFVDIVVTSAAKLLRHCDYVSYYLFLLISCFLTLCHNQKNDSRHGYNHTAVHSFYDTFWERMYKVSIVFTTRATVGAHMEKQLLK